jgi:arsenate reductase-like glutaredoxin family protein
VLVARGKAWRRIDPARSATTDDELAAALLGPTGNLRAPTARVGRTLMVGFHPEVYESVLG